MFVVVRLSNTDALACRWEPWCLVNTGTMSKRWRKLVLISVCHISSLVSWILRELCVYSNRVFLCKQTCREECVCVCCTDLNVLTRSFRSVEMSLMVRRRGPTMFLRLHRAEMR